MAGRERRGRRGLLLGIKVEGGWGSAANVAANVSLQGTSGWIKASISPSPNAVRRRVGRFQDAVKEYLMGEAADSIK